MKQIKGKVCISENYIKPESRVIQNSQAWWNAPIILAILETEAGG